MNYQETFINKSQTWECPKGVSQAIIYKSRTEYKVLEVKPAMKYEIQVSDLYQSFGGFSFQPTDNNQGFYLLTLKGV